MNTYGLKYSHELFLLFKARSEYQMVAMTVDRHQLQQIADSIRRLLLISAAPISEKFVEQILPARIDLDQVADFLDKYIEDGETLVRANGCWQLQQTNAEYLDVSLRRDELSKATLEKLAFIAYRQPIREAAVDIFTVQMLKNLGWIQRANRTGEKYRSLVTTRAFLDELGIVGVNDLIKPQGKAGMT